jgi:putative ABC transport system ATP-binding protein
MVTHDPQAASYADRVVFLKDGEIVHQLERQNGGLSVQSIMDEVARLDT